MGGVPHSCTSMRVARTSTTSYMVVLLGPPWSLEFGMNERSPGGRTGCEGAGGWRREDEGCDKSGCVYPICQLATRCICIMDEHVIPCLELSVAVSRVFARMGAPCRSTPRFMEPPCSFERAMYYSGRDEQWAGCGESEIHRTRGSQPLTRYLSESPSRLAVG